jgi:phage tail sheath protein FI
MSLRRTATRRERLGSEGRGRPSNLSPGVYVEEVEAKPHSIRGVDTAVAAFIGNAPDGMSSWVTHVTSWAEFTDAFGGFLAGSFLPHAVYGYFMNGGRSCHVLRSGRVSVSKDDPAAIATSAPEDVEMLITEGRRDGDQTRVTAALESLQAIDAVTMVCAPDLVIGLGGLIDDREVRAAQQAIIAHCELMGDRMAILDSPPGLDADQILEWRTDTVGYDSEYAVLNWPWIEVFDPLLGTNALVPPSGHIAGVWSRSDDTRGVHKAPANEVLLGAIDVEAEVGKEAHRELSRQGVNCVRAFPGRGIRISGARTTSSDPVWRYLNIRRFMNYVEESILNGTQWAVFESNDRDLWGRLHRAVSAFLVKEWRKGALAGATPAEAFYVKCDDETNPADSIDQGMVVCEVGVAPLKPAEFLVFRLSQFSGGMLAAK